MREVAVANGVTHRRSAGLSLFFAPRLLARYVEMPEIPTLWPI